MSRFFQLGLVSFLSINTAFAFEATDQQVRILARIFVGGEHVVYSASRSELDPILRGYVLNKSDASQYRILHEESDYRESGYDNTTRRFTKYVGILDTTDIETTTDLVLSQLGYLAASGLVRADRFEETRQTALDALVALQNEMVVFGFDSGVENACGPTIGLLVIDVLDGSLTRLDLNPCAGGVQ